MPEEGKKTALDLKMEQEGMVKYTLVDKSAFSIRNSKESELIAKLTANNIGFLVRSDIDVPTGYNTLYVRQEQLETVKKLCAGS